MSIYEEVLAFIQNPRPEQFEPLALAVFAHQFATVDPYRRYCLARGATPGSVRRLDEIPPASTLAFKYAGIGAAAGRPGALAFLTSGTTKGFGERGRHLVPRPEVYRESALRHLRRMLFPDRPRIAMLALHPTADRMPESSLSTMLTWCISEFGTEQSLCAAAPAGLDRHAALEFLDNLARRREPVCILGTTAASAAIFAEIERRGRPIALAPRSRLMDTGGPKGQVIPLTAAQVVERAAALLGIEPALAINEYGMTEMCSQLYDATPFNSARDDPPQHRRKLAPPWLRPTALDPVTLNPLPEGQVGMLAFFDLANVGSISSLMTEDFGIVHGQAVTMLGRAAAAGARGCALGIEEFARHESGPSQEPPR